MAFSLSPSVDVVEQDLSLTIPNLPSAKTGMVVRADDGPAMKIVPITSESDLTGKFSTPTNLNFSDWFDCWNFLQYASSLYAVRPLDIGTSASDYVDGRHNAGVELGAPGDPTGTAVAGLPAKALQTSEGALFNEDVAEVFLSGITRAGTRLAIWNRYVKSNQDLAVLVCSDLTAWSLPVLSKTAFAVIDGTQVSAGFENPVNVKAGHNFRVGDTLDIGGTTDNSITAITATTIDLLNETLLSDLTDLDVIESTNDLSSELSSEIISSTGTISNFSAFFDFTPDFANDEFAILLIKKNAITGKYETVDNEKYVVSWTEGSRDSFGRNIYAPFILTNKSKYIYGSIHDTATTAKASTSYNLLRDMKIEHTSTDAVGAGNMTVSAGTITGGVESPFDVSVFVGGTVTYTGIYSQSEIEDACDMFATPEDFDVNILVANSGVETAVGKFPTIAETRKDCIAVVGITTPVDYVGKSATDAVAAIISDWTPGTGAKLSVANTYMAVFGNFKYQYDRFNDVNRWLSIGGDVAGLMAETDRTRDPWWAAAGLERGKIKNAIKMAFNPSKQHRDDMYVSAINPIMSIPGEGVGIVFGQKTGTFRPSAFDRINVRRLLITLEKAIASASRYSLFEFNDEFTRARIVGMIEPFMRDVKGRRGVYDFLVVCDASNNTSEIIDRNEMVIDVYLKPTKVAEFIRVNMKVTRTDANFNELVGLAA